MRSKHPVIDYQVFTRTISGRKRYYIRFLYQGKVFLTRATDAPTIAKAGAIAARILEAEDLESIAKAKESQKAYTVDMIDRYARMPVVGFLRAFWDPTGSPYIQDLAEHERQYVIRKACRSLGISRSGFYAYRTRTPSNRQLENEFLSGKIVSANFTPLGKCLI